MVTVAVLINLCLCAYNIWQIITYYKLLDRWHSLNDELNKKLRTANVILVEAKRIREASIYSSNSIN